MSDAGFDAIVLKPFKEGDLVKRIGKVLELETISHEVNGYSHAELLAQESQSYSIADISKFCMNDEEMVKEVLIDFCSSTSADLVELDQACVRGDWEELMEIAHKLGSRLGQLKIKASTLARGLEYDLKENNFNNAATMVEKIKKETLVVLDQIVVDFQLFSRVPD